MELINGEGCGAAGGAMAVAGGILALLVIASPVGTVATTVGWGLAAAFGTSFSVAGIGCGIADLIDG
ncbi:MAG: hypothetical protein HF967_07465 [Methanosarcinales archaeon]|nr:hypothetical protein [Methanosarcinales archaeon]